jgi:hypothetical protein
MVPNQEAKLGLLTPSIPLIHVLAILASAIDMWPSDKVSRSQLWGRDAIKPSFHPASHSLAGKRIFYQIPGRSPLPNAASQRPPRAFPINSLETSFYTSFLFAKASFFRSQQSNHILASRNITFF